MNQKEYKENNATKFDRLQEELQILLIDRKIELVKSDYTYSMTLEEDGKIFIIQRDNEENGYVDSDKLCEYFNEDYGFSIESLEDLVDRVRRKDYSKMNLGYEVY